MPCPIRRSRVGAPSQSRQPLSSGRSGSATADGWDTPEDGDLPPLRTTVSVDTTKTIIARNQSPDIPFDRSINPYRGCEHGCSSTASRGRPTPISGCRRGFGWKTRLLMKPEAARLFDRELRKPWATQPAVIAMGTNTDPYQPLEREHRITRGILEVLAPLHHPFTIVTKSTLVPRDLDILGPMGEENLAPPSAPRSARWTATSARKMEARGRRPHRGGSRRSGRWPTPASRRGHGGADDPRAQRSRDGGRSWRPRSRPALWAARYECCASRSRSRTCAPSGWRPMRRAARGMCWRWSATCAAARSTIPACGTRMRGRGRLCRPVAAALPVLARKRHGLDAARLAGPSTSPGSSHRRGRGTSCRWL